MKAIRDALEGQLRISMLRLLGGAGAFSCSDDMLLAALDSLSHSVSLTRVRSELRWLEQAGLVTVTEIDGGVAAKLTDRGLQVAEGRERVDGVGRLRPDLIL